MFLHGISQNIDTENLPVALYWAIIDSDRVLSEIEAAKLPLSYSGNWAARRAEPQ